MLIIYCSGSLESCWLAHFQAPVRQAGSALKGQDTTHVLGEDGSSMPLFSVPQGTLESPQDPGLGRTSVSDLGNLPYRRGSSHSHSLRGQGRVQ